MLTVVKIGEPAVFYRAFYPKLYRFVFIQTGAPHGDVEDIVQEALLAAWSHRIKFDEQSSLETWIAAILKHKIADYWRARRRSEKQVAQAISMALDNQEMAPIPEELLDTSELRQRVEDALSHLTADYSRLLSLRYFKDMPVRQIAIELGESESAVESRLTRARDAFRHLLRGDTHD